MIVFYLTDKECGICNEDWQFILLWLRIRNVFFILSQFTVSLIYYIL